MKKIKNGLFITLEGGEGSGKTTLAKALKEYFTSEGYDVISTREPGGIKVAENIRDIIVNNDLDPITQTYLFAACRRINVQSIIKPALDNGCIVICDRYLTSSIVYQGIVQNVGVDKVLEIMKNATGNILPNLELIIDISAEEGLKRTTNADRNDNNKFDEKGIVFHNMVNSAYREYSCVEYNHKYIIDGSIDKDSVAHQAIGVIHTYINRINKEDDSNV